MVFLAPSLITKCVFYIFAEEYFTYLHIFCTYHAFKYANDFSIANPRDTLFPSMPRETNIKNEKRDLEVKFLIYIQYFKELGYLCLHLYLPFIFRRGFSSSMKLAEELKSEMQPKLCWL